MAIEFRVAGEEDVAALKRADERGFGALWDDARFDAIRPTLELDRFHLAVDGGDIVGVAGVFTLELGLPGGGDVPMGGLTWVSVAASHRRRGLLTRLIDEVHADIDAHGEPLAGLMASQSGIYERFGYGIASHQRVVEIDPRRVRLRPEYAPPPGTVRLVEGEELLGLLPDIHERARRTRPGDLARTPVWQRALVGQRGRSAFYAVHADGYAAWSIEDRWQLGHANNELTVLELVAATPEAHVALWGLVLGIDLVGTVRTARLPLDDPLPYLVDDPRGVRTVALNDALWLNVRDVAACFGRRAYATDDDVVIESGGARYRIGAGGCRKVRSRPDLWCDHSALGPLLLGGVRPSVLAGGRRLTARDEATLRRADALFGWAPLPFLQTPF